MSRGDKEDQLCHLKPTLEKASLEKGLQEAPFHEKATARRESLCPRSQGTFPVADRPSSSRPSFYGGSSNSCDSIALRSLCISYFGVEVGVLSSSFFGGAFEHRLRARAPRALIRGDLKMHDCRRRAQRVSVSVFAALKWVERGSTEPHHAGDSREFGGQASAELDGGDGADGESILRL